MLKFVKIHYRKHVSVKMLHLKKGVEQLSERTYRQVSTIKIDLYSTLHLLV